MDPKVYDLQDRLARLTREEDNLNAEVRLLTASGRQALTGEKAAKYKWIESRLVEIQAWKRQLTEKLDKARREQADGH